MRHWILNQLIALDQSVNTAFGGYPDETISSRAGKAMLAGKAWGKSLCWVLNKLEKDHCLKAIECGGKHGPTCGCVRGGK